MRFFEEQHFYCRWERWQSPFPSRPPPRGMKPSANFSWKGHTTPRKLNPPVCVLQRIFTQNRKLCASFSIFSLLFVEPFVYSPILGVSLFFVFGKFGLEKRKRGRWRFFRKLVVLTGIAGWSPWNQSTKTNPPKPIPTTNPPQPQPPFFPREHVFWQKFAFYDK